MIQKMTVSGFSHYEIIDTENHCETIAAVKNYIAALKLWNLLNDVAEETYAKTEWSWEDVAAIRPDWTEDQCRKWWETNERGFAETLTQYGNEMLACMLY
jgi:hypothetical protein